MKNRSCLLPLFVQLNPGEKLCKSIGVYTFVCRVLAEHNMWYVSAATMCQWEFCSCFYFRKEKKSSSHWKRMFCAHNENNWNSKITGKLSIALFIFIFFILFFWMCDNWPCVSRGEYSQPLPIDSMLHWIVHNLKFTNSQAFNSLSIISIRDNSQCFLNRL